MKVIAGTCLLLLTSAVSASSSFKPKQLRRTRDHSRETLQRSVEAIDPALEINHAPHVVRDSRIVGGRPATAGSYPYFGRYCKILSARCFITVCISNIFLLKFLQSNGMDAVLPLFMTTSFSLPPTAT
jgi:hypothetical protein